MSTKLETFLQSLNPVQKEAVLHHGSPLLILAGAGSGKTRVIIGKIAYLIQRQGIDPRSILAVTFTNKAAEEMRTRAADLEPRAGDVMIKTFHSFGAWLLRRNASLVGLSSQFTIYDDDDQQTLLKSLFPGTQQNVLRALAHQISRAKDFGLTPDHDLSTITGDPEFRADYRTYEKRLREIGNADFGDLILRTTHLLEDEPLVKKRIHERFQVILVDEYQDSNIAQYQMLRALCSDQTYICVVGDDDQSIYRFRGAEIANILQFSQHFPGTDTIRLEQNYRSTGNILALASAVVGKNEGRLGKELWTHNPDGDLPQIVMLDSAEDEAREITALLQQDIRTGTPLTNTAILYRTNAQSRLFETSLLHAAIPYRIVGTLRFYEREEIKDALAFLKFIANPKDEISFRRIINKPARGLGNATLSKILSHLGPAQGNIALALEFALPGLSAKARTGAGDFLKLYTGLNDPPQKGSTLASWLEALLETSRLMDYHQQQDEIAGTQKIQNLEELVNAASLYPNTTEGLVDFLEAVELDSSRETGEDGENGVTLITMHNTKGLEFSRVICTGMEEGLFPRNGDDSSELEEERRLFYVAATRAQHQLVFTTCRTRRIHGRIVDSLPSRFLGEIPPELRTLTSLGMGGYTNAFSDSAGSTRRKETAYQGDWGRPVNLESSRSMNPQAQQQKLKATFPKGTRIYHDDYGVGEIVKSTFNGSDEVVLVRFESGRTATFLPKYNQLDRIQ